MLEHGNKNSAHWRLLSNEGNSIKIHIPDQDGDFR